MKLKTGLQIGAVFPILLAILVSAGLLAESRQAGRVGRTLSDSANLVAETTRLGALTQAWLADPAPAAEAKWIEHHTAIGKILVGVQVASFEERRIAGSVGDAHKAAKADFDALAAALRARGGGAEAAALPERERRLAADLQEKIGTMVVDGARLGAASHVASAATRNVTNVLMASLFGVLALAMAGALLLVGGRIVRRFEAIREGIGTMAQGNLDHPIETACGDDELDLILHSFNTLRRQLRESHDILKKEASDHRSAAESLRKANMILSDALVKLKRAQKQVIDSARLGALKQMATGIEHNFNNTLSPILGLSDFMLAYPESLNDRNAVVENILTINEAVKKAREQIHRLGEFFRPARDARTRPVSLNELVQQAVHDTRRLWMDGAKARGATIEMKTDLAEIPLVEADRTDVLGVLTSLIRNAVEAMPKGGTLSIATFAEGGQAAIRVSDTGEGMTEEVRGRCFEPFFSTRGDGAAGMGLTVVSGTVRRYGGSVDIDSACGAGATVTIRLPVNAGAAVAAAEAGQEQKPPAGRLKLLVADDEAWMRHICKAALTSEGHTVETAADGAEALEKFRAGSFDAAIIDRAMPKMSGDELAAAIRKERPSVRVVLLTGFGDVLLEQGVKPEGVDVVLSKPVSVDALHETLAKLTGKR